MRQAVTSPTAAPVIGPYSPGLRVGNLLFLSGQIPLDPKTGQLAGDDVRSQAVQVMENIGELLRAAGVGFDAVARTTVFLQDMNDFAVMNEVYASYFQQPYPARSTVQVARLPKDVKIEIDLIAMVTS